MMKKITSLIYKYEDEILVLVINFLCLLPVVTTSRTHDDAVYYYLRGSMINNGIGFMTILKDSFLSFWERGRFFPLSLHALIVYYLVDNNNVLYKLLIVLFTCINVWQLGRLVQNIFKNKKIKIYSMLLISVFFQVYVTYHNALVGYHLFMQLMVMLLLPMLSCIYFYLNTGEQKYIFRMIVFFTLAMLAYEIGFLYALVCCFACLFRKESLEKKIKNELCLVGSPIVLALVNIYVKTKYSVGYAGISVNVDLMAILKTWIKQLIAAVPFSYALFQNPKGGVKEILSFYFSGLNLRIIIICALVLLLCYKLKRESDTPICKIDYKYYMLFVVLGMLYLGCAGLIALTAKYQNELVLGIAHISVYIEYFLLLLIIIFLVVKHHDKIKKSWFRFCIICVTIIGVWVNGVNAQAQSDLLYKYGRYSYEFVIEAMRDGVFDEIPAGSNLVIRNYSSWDSSDFYAEFSGKSYNVVLWDDFIAQLNQGFQIEKNTYLVEYNACKDIGLVKIGQLVTIVDNDGGVTPITDINYIYTQSLQQRAVWAKTSDGKLIEGMNNDCDMLFNDYQHIILKYDSEMDNLNYDSIAVVYGCD